MKAMENKWVHYESESKYDDNSVSDSPRDSSGCATLKKVFFSYCSSLIIIISFFFTCSFPATLKNITNKSSQLIVKLTCSNNHGNVWKSQNYVYWYCQGKLALPAAVLFSESTFEGIGKVPSNVKPE